MKNNKGFTLIEMLVVVAIVGILSATVLTALGPSRNKAKDARIVSALNQIRVIAETLYDGSTGKYPTAEKLESNSGIDKAILEIKNQGIDDSDIDINCDANNTICAFSSKLLTSGSYCVDTKGKTSSSTATNGSCQ